jgi:hypothetical protein
MGTVLADLTFGAKTKEPDHWIDPSFFFWDVSVETKGFIAHHLSPSLPPSRPWPLQNYNEQIHGLYACSPAHCSSFHMINCDSNPTDNCSSVNLLSAAKNVRTPRLSVDNFSNLAALSKSSGCLDHNSRHWSGRWNGQM